MQHERKTNREMIGSDKEETEGTEEDRHRKKGRETINETGRKYIGSYFILGGVKLDICLIYGNKKHSVSLHTNKSGCSLTPHTNTVEWSRPLTCL